MLLLGIDLKSPEWLQRGGMRIAFLTDVAAFTSICWLFEGNLT